MQRRIRPSRIRCIQTAGKTPNPTLTPAGTFAEALHGLLNVTTDKIEKNARSASKRMWKLFTVDG